MHENFAAPGGAHTTADDGFARTVTGEDLAELWPIIELASCDTIGPELYWPEGIGLAAVERSGLSAVQYRNTLAEVEAYAANHHALTGETIGIARGAREARITRPPHGLHRRGSSS